MARSVRPCKLCLPPVYFDSTNSYVRHCILHKNVPNVAFPCYFQACSIKFRSVSALRMHISRNHIHNMNVFGQGKRCVAQNAELHFRCLEALCGQEVVGLRSFLDHLRMHIADGMQIVCPFIKCGKKIDSKPKFSMHIHRLHRNCSGKLINSTHLITGDDGTNAASLETVVDIPVNAELDQTEDSMQQAPNLNETQNLQDLFIHNLALFYLKLQAKYLIPVSNVEMIIKDFEEVHGIGQAHVNNVLKNVLEQNKTDVDVQAVVEAVADNDLLRMCNTQIFNSACKRKTFFEKNFQFVSPQKIFLGIDKHGQKRYCQYVPILQNIKKFVAKYSRLFEQSSSFQNSEILSDVHDGSVCKDNALFRSEENALKIMLYQDAFQCTNPLASASTRHKLLGVYFTLANLPACYRSTVDHIQLVVLCREQDVKVRTGLNKVLARIVNDLKKLETHGIMVNGVCYKGSLVALLGDNLGSHFVGGFTENFSTSEYFCRFCDITRKQFHDTPYSLGSNRNAVTYESDAQAASDAQQLSGKMSESVHGIKFRSELCRLTYYHVCNPGLPPCLAHDLFEGIIAVDMALFIKYFVNNVKWFNYRQLNHAIAQFQYVGSDSSTKPAELHDNAKKLSGQAVQNWCFIRLFPLFVLGKVKDFKDKVWLLILKLRQITELICAPRISKRQIGMLLILIEEYLYDRAQNFPDQALKPKHHFLCHYPSLMIKFGPLIHLWTLRFESKHSYFKRCARAVKNFLNLSHSLAQKHQMLQAYYSAGSLFTEDAILEKCTELSLTLISSNMKQTLFSRGISIEQCVCASVATFRGTTYREGQFVVLPSFSNAVTQTCTILTYPVAFGKIKLIIQHKESEQLYFIVEEYSSVYTQDLHLATVVASDRLQCISQSELHDYHPLSGYCLGQKVYISLHHSVC